MNPEQLLEEISQFVSDSRDVLKQGAMMELSGLENRVLLMCEQIAVLSQEERDQYADRLRQLMGDLTALSEEIMEQRDKLTDEIRNLPSHHKAHKAYQTTSVRNPDDDEEE
jgi:gas vesicle protein